jgi:hypothetical protein
MTNLINEFIGDDDAKTLFKKSVLFNNEFHEVLDIFYSKHELAELVEIMTNVNSNDEIVAFANKNIKVLIKEKLRESNNSINKSEILLYREDGVNRISFKHFYNKGKWFEGNYLEIEDYEMKAYDEERLKNEFQNWVNGDDILFAYYSSTTIRSYLLRCGIVIPMEQIEYMMDYNNEDALHILVNLIRNNLIDNAPTFVDFMMEEHREEVIDTLFQEGDYTIKFEVEPLKYNKILIVLTN